MEKIKEPEKTIGEARKPDGFITTKRDGQIIISELFWDAEGSETFRDKLLRLILTDRLRLAASEV